MLKRPKNINFCIPEDVWAALDAAVSQEEFYRIYLQNDSSTGHQNSCCAECQKAYGGCNWSRDFSPVPGWITVKTDLSDRYHDQSGTKILYCPEFVEGAPSKKYYKTDDESAFIRLWEGVLHQAKLDYAKYLRAEFETHKKLWHTDRMTLQQYNMLKGDIGELDGKQRSCEYVFGRFASKARVETLNAIFRNAVTGGKKVKPCVRRTERISEK